MRVYKSYYTDIVITICLILVSIDIVWFVLSFPESFSKWECIIIALIGSLAIFQFTKELITCNLSKKIRYYEVVYELPDRPQLIEYKNMSLAVGNDFACILSKKQVARHKDRLKNNTPIKVIKYYGKDKVFLYKIYKI